METQLGPDSWSRHLDQDPRSPTPWYQNQVNAGLSESFSSLPRNDVALENKSGHEKHVQIGTFAGEHNCGFLKTEKGGGGPDILQRHTSTQRFRISLWVFLALSLRPTLSMWGIKKPSGHFPTGYFSQSPVGIDYVTHEQRQSAVEPRRNLVPAMCVSWQVARLSAHAGVCSDFSFLPQ